MKDFLEKNKIAFLLLLLFLDFFVLLLGYVFGDKAIFNLDIESNLPTIYQGVKIILVSFLTFDIFLFTKNKSKYFWLFLSVAFLFLGMDEIGQIHENLPTFLNEFLIPKAIQNPYDYLNQYGYESTTWLPYYLPLIGIFLMVGGVYIVKFLKTNWRRASFFILGVLCLVGGILVEYLNTKPDIMFQEGYYRLVFWEESLEVLGISFILFFAYLYFRDVLSTKIFLRKND